MCGAHVAICPTTADDCVLHWDISREYLIIGKIMIRWRQDCFGRAHWIGLRPHFVAPLLTITSSMWSCTTRHNCVEVAGKFGRKLHSRYIVIGLWQTCRQDPGI